MGSPSASLRPTLPCATNERGFAPQREQRPESDLPSADTETYKLVGLRQSLASLDQRRAFATRGTGQRSIVVCTSDQPSGRRDASEAADQTVPAIIERTEPPKPTTNLAAVDLGKLGGLRGGTARREMHHDFARTHRAVRMSPAMATGVTETLWSASNLVTLLEEHEAQAAA